MLTIRSVMVVMMFAIPPVVIEVAVMCKIGPVFSMEPFVIMFIIDPVAIMSVP